MHDAKSHEVLEFGNFLLDLLVDCSFCFTWHDHRPLHTQAPQLGTNSGIQRRVSTCDMASSQSLQLPLSARSSACGKFVLFVAGQGAGVTAGAGERLLPVAAVLARPPPPAS